MPRADDSPHADPVPAGPVPLLYGHGLALCPWDPASEADVDAWLRGQSDDEFRRWNTPLMPVTDLDTARAHLRSKVEGAEQGTSVPFRVTDAGTGETLGQIGLNAVNRVMRTARVGYWVLPEARGRGVATRALAVAARWSLTEFGLHRLELDHADGHDVSCRVAVRCGFRLEGTLRDATFAAGRHDAFRHMHLHARLATDPEPNWEHI
ncbi:GNAT family N-acetyltransferase [Streptomyces roseirectus]|uniref:GNAT family N-acetyltransferase n=1 Tax=Streptomyces roseirectus TaxID=2768066 RepID=A0A7H0IGZ2_9ACTN|nr:GNAT family N-acetyltransferase [Streptomyces roseirectus]QNP72058.1 GNAT family N-acetyltransferase [Streptomyces roseirectus]